MTEQTHTGGAAGAARRTATLANVQALRGVAAAVVVLAHVSGPDGTEKRIFGSEWTTWSNLPANTGVDLFFVISGLIMVVTTWGSFDARGSARAFLYRRVTRIYPLYWLLNTAILALLLLSPGSVSFDNGQHLDAGRVLGSYLLLPPEGRLPVLVAWTLVHEMFFYLLFTLALLIGRRWLGWVMAAWVAATVVLSATVGESGQWLAIVASPLNLEFVLGVAIGYAVVRGRLVRPRLVLVVGVVAAAVLLASLAASGWEAFPSTWVRVAGPGLVAALLVYGAVGVEVRRAATAPAFLQRLGDASYSLYLVHVPALTLLAAVLAGRVPSGGVAHAVVLLLVAAYVLAAAFLCHRLVERPLLVFFRHRGSRRRGSPAATRRAGARRRADTGETGTLS